MPSPSLISWLVGWLDWMIGWLVGWIGWLYWLVGWVGWLDWLVGWAGVGHDKIRQNLGGTKINFL